MKILFFALLFSANSIAQELVDPHNILQQIDQFLGNKSLRESFSDFDTFEQKNKECVQIGPCDESERFYSFEYIEATNQEQEKVILSRHSNQNPEAHTEEITAEFWSQIQGNLLRFEILKAKRFGQQVTLHTLENSTESINFNGIPKTIPTKVVKLSISNGTKLELHYTNLLRGLMQELRRKKTTNFVVKSKLDKYITSVELY